MRYTERKYIQNNHSGLRNKENNKLRTSTDWCVFNPPLFNVTGATIFDVNYTGYTENSNGINIIPETGTTFNVDIKFTGNFDSFTAYTTNFKFDIFGYDETTNEFVLPSLYTSDSYGFSDISGSSAITVSIPISGLNIDNEYILKPSFEFDVCTEIGSFLGETYDSLSLYGNNYGLYNDYIDYYLSVFRNADTPIFRVSSANTETLIGDLVGYTIIPDVDNQTDFILKNYLGNVMVNLNGLTLSNNFDYTISGYTLNISAGTKTTDIINIIHNYNDNISIGLTQDVIIINTPIVSGATNNQGNNKIYYNTTKNKYEIYTDVDILETSDVVVTLNGLTLANNIDYYKSITNKKRVILNGDVVFGDVLNIFYYPYATFVKSIYTNIPNISWYITNPPQKENGYFITEVSNDIIFSGITYTSQTDYIVGQLNYSDSIVVSGTVGDMFYYRVKNMKNYETLNGDIITTSVSSETIPIKIMTNYINSY